MKRRTHTPAEAARWLEFQAIRPPTTARTWLVHFAEHDPVVRRYQHPVSLSRVLSDHRAAITAEPME